MTCSVKVPTLLFFFSLVVGPSANALQVLSPPWILSQTPRTSTGWQERIRGGWIREDYFAGGVQITRYASGSPESLRWLQSTGLLSSTGGNTMFFAKAFAEYRRLIVTRAQSSRPTSKTSKSCLTNVAITSAPKSRVALAAWSKIFCPSASSGHQSLVYAKTIFNGFGTTELNGALYSGSQANFTVSAVQEATTSRPVFNRTQDCALSWAIGESGAVIETTWGVLSVCLKG